MCECTIIRLTRDEGKARMIAQIFVFLFSVAGQERMCLLGCYTTDRWTRSGDGGKPYGAPQMVPLQSARVLIMPR